MQMSEKVGASHGGSLFCAQVWRGGTRGACRQDFSEFSRVNNPFPPLEKHLFPTGRSLTSLLFGVPSFSLASRGNPSSAAI